MNWLTHHGFQGFMFDHAFARAVREGRLRVAQELHGRLSRRMSYLHSIMDAVDANHLGLVQWITENLREGNFYLEDAEESAIFQALNLGYYEIAQWLHAHQRESGTGIWLHENTSVYCSTTATDAAAENGHLEVVQWLHTRGSTTKAMDAAAHNGHLHVVKRLHENRSGGCTTAAMDKAASLEIVEWLHTNRTEGCTTEAMDRAAASGDVESLLFLHEYGAVECTIDAAEEALCGEYVDVFEWLVANYPEIMDIEEIREDIDKNEAFASVLLRYRDNAKRQRVS